MICLIRLIGDQAMKKVIYELEIINSKLYFLETVGKPSAIRQKSESQNGCYNKTKHAKFYEKRTFLNP